MAHGVALGLGSVRDLGTRARVYIHKAQADLERRAHV